MRQMRSNEGVDKQFVSGWFRHFSGSDMSQVSRVLAILVAFGMSVYAWTDATCNAAYPNYLPYACTFGSGTACGGKCGYGPTSVGSVSCCGSKPPTCASLNIPAYTDCSNSLCHTSWANYGSCTGCGSNGVQKQTQPCVSGATGSPNSRTVSVTCGMSAMRL